MARFKDQAICIREFDWSETSQVVVLVTERHGKIRGLAKGSKRLSPSSIERFSGGIDLLTLGQVVGVIRPAAELVTVTEWDLQNDYHHLRTDLAAQQRAMYAADLAGALLADHDVHPVTFNAIATLLDDLAEPATVESALLRFQWRLLEDAGFKPELNNDIRTGSLIRSTNAYTFDPKAGGFTSQKQPGDLRVRKQTLDLLRQIAAGICSHTTCDDESIRRANRLLCVYAGAILDRELPTMQLVLNSI